MHGCVHGPRAVEGNLSLQLQLRVRPLDLSSVESKHSAAIVHVDGACIRNLD